MSKKGRRRRTPEQRIAARQVRSDVTNAARTMSFEEFQRWIRRMGGKPNA